MKRTLALTAFGTLLAAGAIAAHAADVGVSVSIGQPGYYGRLDIGNFPQPVVLYPQPVVIAQQAQYASGPLYLRVPPEHRRHWSRHCGYYQACGVPVYFVQDRWYRDVYAPRYVQEHRGYRDDDRRGWDRRDRDDGRGHDRGRHGGRGHD